MIFLGCLKISWTDPPVCVCAECPPWGQNVLGLDKLRESIGAHKWSHDSKQLFSFNLECHRNLIYKFQSSLRVSEDNFYHTLQYSTSFYDNLQIKGTRIVMKFVKI